MDRFFVFAIKKVFYRWIIFYKGAILNSTVNVNKNGELFLSNKEPDVKEVQFECCANAEIQISLFLFGTQSNEIQYTK